MGNQRMQRDDPPCPFVFDRRRAAAGNLWRGCPDGLRGRVRRGRRDDDDENDDEEDEADDQPHLDVFPPRFLLQLHRLQRGWEVNGNLQQLQLLGSEISFRSSSPSLGTNLFRHCLCL